MRSVRCSREAGTLPSPSPTRSRMKLGKGADRMPHERLSHREFEVLASWLAGTNVAAQLGDFRSDREHLPGARSRQDELADQRGACPVRHPEPALRVTASWSV